MTPRSLLILLLLFGVFAVDVNLCRADDGQEDLDKALELKLNAENMRDLDKVVELCQSAIEKGLDKEQTAFAKQLWASTLFEHATRLSRPILEQTPPDHRWQVLRQQALPRLEKAIEIRPDWPEAYYLMARLQALSGQREPVTDPLSIYLALQQLEALPNGNRDAALEAINKAAENVDNADPALVIPILTWQAVLTKDETKQMEILEKAINSEGDTTDPLRVRSLVHVLKEDTEAAIADFRLLIEKDPENSAYRQSLIEALSRAGKVDEALAELNQLVESSPENAEVYMLRARFYITTGETDKALEDLNKLLEINSEDWIALLLRARIYLEKEQLAEAKADIDEALTIQPGSIEGILTRSIIATLEERYADAIEDLELLSAARPNDPELLLRLAMLYYADERPTPSIEKYSRVLSMDKDNFLALRGRGDAYLGIGKHTEALKDYEHAYEVDPDDDALLNNYAWLLATSPDDELRDGNRAIELAKKACELTDYELPHILSTLASGYAEIGDFETAKDWAKKAVDMAEGEQKEGLQEELDSYEQKKPWREREELKDRVPSAEKEDLDLS